MNPISGPPELHQPDLLVHIPVSHHDVAELLHSSEVKRRVVGARHRTDISFDARTLRIGVSAQDVKVVLQAGLVHPTLDGDALPDNEPVGAIIDYLEADHRRLARLLDLALAPGSRIEPAPYVEFRAGLLRHIAMEEKVLLPVARRLRNGEALPAAAQLKRDHAALASLLVPPPTADMLGTVSEILEEHNLLEEGPSGVYAECEIAFGESVHEVLEQLRAVTPPRLAPNYDTPLAYQHLQTVLNARKRG